MSTIVDITDDLGEVDFSPGGTFKEVMQNVKTILTTRKGSVPMDREFGIDGAMVDMPIAAAQAKMTAEIVAAVQKYEPRVKVVSVQYDGKEMEGRLGTKVRVRIDGV